MKVTAVFALTICLLSPSHVLGAGPKGAKAKTLTPTFYQVTYQVSDLPVWRGESKTPADFAPNTLMSFLRLAVDPYSWTMGADIRPFPEDAALVIAQSQANHRKIANMFESYRDSVRREKEGQARGNR